MIGRRHLGSCGLLSNSGHSYLFKLFWWTVTLIHELPFYEWLSLRHPFGKGHEPLQPLLCMFSGLFTDEGSPLTVVYAKGNGRRKLDKLFKKNKEWIMNYNKK